MRIKRFNEEATEKLSDDRVNDIIKELGDFKAIIVDKIDVITGLSNELAKYTLKDSKSSLQNINTSLTTTSDELDTIINDLENYKIDYSLDQQKNNNSI